MYQLEISISIILLLIILNKIIIKNKKARYFPGLVINEKWTLSHRVCFNKWVEIIRVSYIYYPSGNWRQYSYKAILAAEAAL
jgi:hypothetical protein